MLDDIPRSASDQITSPLRNELLDFHTEVIATQGAFCLDFEPFAAAFEMEVVLRIAFEDYDLILRLEMFEADGALGHIFILILVDLHA